MTSSDDTPLGPCQCGCGQPTTIADRTDPKTDRVKGRPMRYIRGHSRRGTGQSREERLAAQKRWREANAEHRREYRRRKLEEDPDRARADQKRWREANREQRAERMKAWREANVEHRRAYKKQWYADNRESELVKRRKAVREWRAANRERHRATVRAWQRANPEKYKALRRRESQSGAARVRSRLNGWRRRGGLGGTAEWVSALMADPCAYCGSVADSIDHIVPLAAGGMNDWDNLTAACRRCNSRKNARPLLTFLDVLREEGLDLEYRLAEAA